MEALPDLGTLSDQELRDLIRELMVQEHKVSYERRLLHGKIDSNDVLTDVSVLELQLAESYEGGRHRFDGDIELDRGGPFGYTVRVIPRNELLASVAELGVVAVA